jgi:hypothetical protein
MNPEATAQMESSTANSFISFSVNDMSISFSVNDMSISEFYPRR